MTAENGQHEQPVEEPTTPRPSPDPRGDIVRRNRQLKLLRRIDELRGHGAHDARWLAQAKTKMEEAFMCLGRAVEQHERLEGDIDE